MIYDTDMFSSFREKAITKISDIEVGKKYFSNCYPDVFVVNEIGKNDIGHFIVTEKNTMVFLGDRNVGESYNPWLIFDNIEIAAECVQRLKVTYEDVSTYDYDYNDYDYVYDELEFV